MNVPLLPTRGITSSNVGKYREGQYVQGLAGGSVTGTIMRIEANNGSNPPQGPGTMFIQLADAVPLSNAANGPKVTSEVQLQQSSRSNAMMVSSSRQQQQQREQQAKQQGGGGFARMSAATMSAAKRGGGGCHVDRRDAHWVVFTAVACIVTALLVHVLFVGAPPPQHDSPADYAQLRFLYQAYGGQQWTDGNGGGGGGSGGNAVTAAAAALPAIDDGPTVPSPAPSSYQLTWDTAGSSMCTWKGVKCVPDPNDSAIQRVASLSLRAVGIQSRADVAQPTCAALPFPSGIFAMDQLTSLDLSGNSRLLGSLPAAVGGAAALQTLLLNGTGLSGSLPRELMTLHQLTALDLSGCGSLQGTIPDVSGLYKIRALSLAGCSSLSGNLPEGLEHLATLTSLRMADMRIGPITGAGQEGCNGVRGTLPRNLGDLTHLRELHLGGNCLEGTIPTSVQSLSNLLDFNLSDNRLSGTIPDEICNIHPIVFKCDFGNGEPPATPPLAIADTPAPTPAFKLGANKFTQPCPSCLPGLCNAQSAGC